MAQRLCFRLIISALVCLVAFIAIMMWSPVTEITDGRHDLGRNGIWLQHGWLGNDSWFERNGKQDLMSKFRDDEATRELAAHLRTHGMTDVFPHLCPTQVSGEIALILLHSADFLKPFWKRPIRQKFRYVFESII